MRAAWLTAVVLCAWAVSVAEGADSTWEALRAPGSVVVLRHSFAPGGFDPPGARLDDCSTQRSLDDSGRAQARRIHAESIVAAALLTGVSLLASVWLAGS